MAKNFSIFDAQSLDGTFCFVLFTEIFIYIVYTIIICPKWIWTSVAYVARSVEHTNSICRHNTGISGPPRTSTHRAHTTCTHSVQSCKCARLSCGIPKFFYACSEGNLACMHAARHGVTIARTRHSQSKESRKNCTHAACKCKPCSACIRDFLILRAACLKFLTPKLYPFCAGICFVICERWWKNKNGKNEDELYEFHIEYF